MEASSSIEIAKHTLLSGGLILAIGTITGLAAQKIRIPDVAVFPLVGMVVGPEALGLISRPSPRSTRSSFCSERAIFFSTAGLRCA
jgi:Kef-type K+ transport system membrane component KefB